MEIRPKSEAPKYTQWASPARPKILASGGTSVTNYEDPAVVNTQRRNSPPSTNTNGRNGGDPQRSNHQSQTAARIANIVQNSLSNSPNIGKEATEESAHISPTSSSSGLPPTSSPTIKLASFANPPSSRHYQIQQQQQQHTPPPSVAIINAAQQRAAIQSRTVSATAASTASRLPTLPPLSPMQSISSATTVLNSPNVSAATMLPRMSMVPASYSLSSSSASNTSSTVAVSATSVATIATLRNGMDFHRDRDHRPPPTQGSNRTSPSSREAGLPFYSVASSIATSTSSSSSPAINRYPTSAPSSSVSNANTTTVVPAQPSGHATKHTKQSPSVILGEHGGVKTMIWTDSSLYSQAQAQAQAQAAQSAAEATARNRVSSQPQPTHQLIKLEPGIAAQAVQAAQAAKAKLDVDQQMKMSSTVDGLLSLSSVPPPPRTAPTAPPNVTHSPQIQHLQVRHPQHLVQHSPRPSHSSSSVPQQSPRIVIPGSQQQGQHTQLNIMAGNNNVSPSISPMIRANNNGPTITSSVTPNPFQTFCNTSSPTQTNPNLPPLPINLPSVNNKRRSPMNMERLWAGDQSQLPAHCLENQVTRWCLI